MRAPAKHEQDSDLSENGINRRMRKLSQLYRLGRSLRQAALSGAVRSMREERPPWRASHSHE